MMAVRNGAAWRDKEHLLFSDFCLVQVNNILSKTKMCWTKPHWCSWLQTTYLDDNDQRQLEQRWVCLEIQHRQTRLEGLKESSDVLTKCKVVAEQHLQCKTLSVSIPSHNKCCAYSPSWRWPCWIEWATCPLEQTFQYCVHLGIERM